MREDSPKLTLPHAQTDYSDLRPTTGIVMTDEKLKLALIDFEKARISPGYVESLPWLTAAVTLWVAMSRSINAEDQVFAAIFGTVAAVMSLVTVGFGFKAFHSRKLRAVTVDDTINTIRQG